MLNLTKIHKIRQILSSSAALNFHKCGEEEQVVTPELMDKYRQGDIDAANIIAREILKNVHGAMKHFGIMESVSPQEWQDFRDDTAKRIWEYTVPRYDPSQAQFNTLVFTMVNNMWKNWLKKKSISPLDKGPSLDVPIGEEEGITGMELLQDPFALDFKSEVEAQIIGSALLENIENPRHRELLELWMAEDPRMGPGEKREEVAKKYNAAHPKETPLQGYRMYRIMMDEIYPKVLNMFPEMAGGVGYMKNLEAGPGDVKWVRKPTPEVVKPSGEVTPTEEEEPYIPLEERVAPAYRIDPQTGERTLIGLNMKRKITAAQEAWCHTLLTFLSIERYGQFRRIVKSSTTR